MAAAKAWMRIWLSVNDEMPRCLASWPNPSSNRVANPKCRNGFDTIRLRISHAEASVFFPTAGAAGRPVNV
jgi:hypothetical protein